MGKFTLPVVKDPPINTYLHYAFPFSLLMLNSYYNDWILNNFIQVAYSPQDKCPFDYHEFFYDKWPCLTVCCMKPDMVREQPNILSFIRRMLEEGWYCFAWVDCYFIPGTPLYKKRRDTEGLLIYGYDTTSEPYFQALTYKVRGKNLKYGDTAVAVHDFCRSLESEKFDDLQFVKVNTACSVDYNILRIRKKLIAYLHSQNLEIDNMKYHKQEEITSFGVQACEEAISYLEGLRPADILDLRIPHLFREHKRIMMFRIDKILESYAIPGYPFTADDRKFMIQMADELLYYCMKCGMRGYNDPQTLSRISDVAHRLLEMEREMLIPIIEFPWEELLARL